MEDKVRGDDLKTKRWWTQSKKSFRYFVRTKDIDHIKDIWRLTKFYFGGNGI